MNIDLSNKSLYNEIYLKAIFRKHRYKILYGSRGSGKSFAVAQSFVYYMLNDKYFKGVLVRKVFNTIRDSQFELICSIIRDWGLEDLFTITKAPLEIRCKLNGNKIIARGLDNAEKLKSLTNPTCVWIEEGIEITLNDFLLVDTSIRGPNEKDLQLVITFNPDSEETWINEQFFPLSKSSYEKPDGNFYEVESPKENTYILHSRWTDNKWCPLEVGKIYESLKNLPDQNLYNSWSLGLWGCGLKGRIYENCVEYADYMPDIEDCKHYQFALDFGYANDPTAIVESCLGPNGKIYVQEHCYKTGLVNVDTSGTLANISEEFERIEVGDFEIVADCAEPKSIAELQNVGWNIVPCIKGRDSVVFGIQLIKQYGIVVCGKSPNLKRELRNYVWKEDRDGNSLNIPKEDGNDHALDALRYYALKYLDNNNTTISPLFYM